MNNELVLFIGGPISGSRKRVSSDRDVVQVLDDQTMRVSNYRRKILSGPTRKYSIFAPDWMPIDDIIGHLLNGFKEN